MTERQRAILENYVLKGDGDGERERERKTVSVVALFVYG